MTRRAFGFSLVLALCLLNGCAAVPDAAPQRQVVVNPVLDANFPDPASIKAPDGYYYVYATQGEVDGKMQNIQIVRSRDLQIWERVGDALPAKPAWAQKTQDFWAPHVALHDGLYYLYCSAKQMLRLSTR